MNTKPYYADAPQIVKDGIVYPASDWVFCMFNIKYDCFGNTYEDGVLNNQIRRSKRTVTMYINEMIEKYKDWSLKISVENSYVKCINLRDNRIYNVSYKEWLDTDGNYELFDPQPKEVTIDEW